MITLTQEEREKFAAYLEQHAANDEAIVEAIKSLKGSTMTAMFAKLSEEVRAARIIAKKFRDTETA